MPKIAFLGAGSRFGRRLVQDILSFPELADSTIHLVDPNQERVELVAALARRVAEQEGLPARFVASTARDEALDGADYAIVSIRVGKRFAPEALDVRIPLEVGGLRQTVADTVGIGGIMKGLRTIPVVLDIARDMERRCPEALLLNYTNPMALIMWALSEATTVRAVGLCHSVQHTSRQLAAYVGADDAALRYRVAGINHVAWFLELAEGREDLYPRLRACLDDPATVAKDPVRFEILRHFGYFVTESSRHMAEYVPYFLRDEGEWARLGVSPNTGEGFGRAHAQREEEFGKVRQDLAAGTIERSRSVEYAARILHALETDAPFGFNGNVENTGLVANLPDGCCVEVPCLANRAGVQPCYAGALPPQLVGLCQSNVTMQGLVVRALLDEDREQVYRAAMLDPNTAAQLTLPQIRRALDLLLDAQRELLPPFLRP